MACSDPTEAQPVECTAAPHARLSGCSDAADAPRLLSYAEEVLKTLEEYSSYAQRAYL